MGDIVVGSPVKIKKEDVHHYRNFFYNTRVSEDSVAKVDRDDRDVGELLIIAYPNKDGVYVHLLAVSKNHLVHVPATGGRRRSYTRRHRSTKQKNKQKKNKSRRRD